MKPGSEREKTISKGLRSPTDVIIVSITLRADVLPPICCVVPHVTANHRSDHAIEAFGLALSWKSLCSSESVHNLHDITNALNEEQNEL